MADVSSIVGIILMAIGGLFILTGMVLCYTTKVGPNILSCLP